MNSLKKGAIRVSVATGQRTVQNVPGNTVVRVIVGLEGGKEPLAEAIALLLRGDDAGRRRGAVEVVDVTAGTC